MFRGLKLFWSVLRWWEKILVVVLLPAVLAMLVFLAIISRGTNRQDRDVENSLDGFLRHVDEKDKKHQEDLDELDDDITKIFERKAVIEEEKNDAFETISGCDGIGCVDSVLLERRERRRAARRGD